MRPINHELKSWRNIGLILLVYHYIDLQKPFIKIQHGRNNITLETI